MAFFSDAAWLAGWLTVVITIVTIACSVYDGESKRKRILKDIEIYENWLEIGSADALKNLRDRIDSEIDKLSIPFYNRYAYQIMLAIGAICTVISFPLRQLEEYYWQGVLALCCGLMMIVFYLFGSIFEIVLKRKRINEKKKIETAIKAVYWSYFRQDSCDDEIKRDMASERYTRELRDSLAWILGSGDPIQEKVSKEILEKVRRQVIEENQEKTINDYLAKRNRKGSFERQEASKSNG